jgi:hypothetical protein
MVIGERLVGLTLLFWAFFWQLFTAIPPLAKERHGSRISNPVTDLCFHNHFAPGTFSGFQFFSADFDSLFQTMLGSRLIKELTLIYQLLYS